MSKSLTNEEFLQKLKDNNIKYIPLEEYKGSHIKIKWMCYENNKHIFEMKPSHIFDNHGCPYCSHKKVFIGETDIWTTNPELASMLLNPSDGYKYTNGSSVKLDWVCKKCGSIVKNKSIKNVKNNGLSCNFCSDGVSYPEKFISEMFRQLNIEFIFNKTFSWSKLKRYDFYIPNLSLIVESNGRQHYCDNFNFRKYNNNKKSRTLDEEKENDIYKMKLAFDNGIKTYISLDCRESNLDFIKQSILKSELNNIFDLSNIDWTKCHNATFSSTTIEVCNLWNNGMHYVKRIAKITNINYTTVIKKLKLCNEQGLCDYKPYTSKGRFLNKNTNNKKVICIETKKIYNSISDVEKDGYSRNQVSRCCNKIHKTHKGLHWSFI